jgi:hypothetical protein
VVALETGNRVLASGDLFFANVVWSYKFRSYQSSREKSGQLNFRLVVLVDARFEKQREWSGF